MIGAGEARPGTGRPVDASVDGSTEATELDLVLRSLVNEDDTFEVPAKELAVLARLGGDRLLAAIPAATGMAAPHARGIAVGLLERGLLGGGREDRRRQPTSYQL